MGAVGFWIKWIMLCSVWFCYAGTELRHNQDEVLFFRELKVKTSKLRAKTIIDCN